MEPSNAITSTPFNANVPLLKPSATGIVAVHIPPTVCITIHLDLTESICSVE